jgi:hypothetical protein
MAEKNIYGYKITSIIFAIFFGALSGLIWSFALGNQIKSGVYYGAIVGSFIGFILSLNIRKPQSDNNINEKESSTVTGSILGFLFLISSITALITGVIRWLF